jgi:hypothetical protein
MTKYPDHLKDYSFSGPVFKHLVCLAAEGRYEYTFKDRFFLPNGELYNRFGTVVARLVISPVIDPNRLTTHSSFTTRAVIKNPINATAIYAEEGYKNALIETDNWMYLATVHKEGLRIQRPVRQSYYDNLRVLLAQATSKIDQSLLHSF